MKIYSTYKVKIKHYNHIFKDTISIYRKAVDYLIGVCLNEWNNILLVDGNLAKVNYIEHICHQTKANPHVRYSDFDTQFYKFPSYLRRGAIQEALGKVASYQSNLANWKAMDKATRGKQPTIPKAGYVYPCMYRKIMYEQTGTYTAKIKVFVRNTWDFIVVHLRKSDMDYIERHCSSRKQCAPTLQKRGKEWFLDFPFEENVKLNDRKVDEQIVVAVDLGIKTAATISVMCADGTILGRHFYKLTKEIDCLMHSVNRIKKAQQHGNYKTPRLWNRTKGINHNISCQTANFIMDIVALYDADMIVFEHLDKNGKAKGSKKQKLKLWRSQEVQAIVTNKAHRIGVRVNHVNAWNTSRFAYDGSGVVLRGKDANLATYELCKFPSGKVYNCDLSASYNIGARYFIQERIKSLSAKTRLHIEAKVPQCCKRSTCTFSTLISLNAELASV